MSTVPSPAELRWRIRWLAGTAVPPPPEPAPQPEPEPAWLQAPTLAEIEPTPRRGRSLLRDSIRVELRREAERVYVAAQQEMRRQIGAAYPYRTVPHRCAECDCEARRHAA